VLQAPRGRSPFPAAVTATVGGRQYRFVFQRIHSVAFDLWDILLQPWVLGGLVLALSGGGAALLARSLTRPIHRLQARVRAIAEGEFKGAADANLTTRRDELGALARDVDDMAQRLQGLIAAREAMLRDVSHELRAPLARLRALADLARKRGESPPLARIDREIDRIDALIGQILRFARLQAETDLAAEPIDFAALVEEVAADARLEAAAGGKQLILRSRAPAPMTADPRLVRSAVENVMRNAVRFSPKGGKIEVVLDAEAGHARLQVMDRGPGVRPADLPHIFEPFRGEGSGAGLGLAITRRVMALHRGSVEAANRPGGGLVVTLTLPHAAPDAGELPYAQASVAS
jgi:two-component system sensor histidine kinase CpxA